MRLSLLILCTALIACNSGPSATNNQPGHDSIRPINPNPPIPDEIDKLKKEKEALRLENERMVLGSDLSNLLEITPNYTAEALGGISNASILLTNHYKYALTKICVNVSYEKSNGGSFYSQKAICDNLEPNKTIRIELPNQPRGIRIETLLNTVECPKIDFYYNTGAKAYPKAQ